MEKPTKIAPPKGKLGVLLPGMGAVATTFMAGVELVRTKKAQPVGSLTQLGTIRLGKRTEGRSPKIKDFVQLARLEDLVFGGWDIFPESAYEAAANAGVLDPQDLAEVKTFLVQDQADEGGVRPRVREDARRHERQEREEQVRDRAATESRHRQFQEEARVHASGDAVVRLDRSIPEGRRSPRHAGKI